MIEVEAPSHHIQQIAPLNFTLVDWAFVKKFQQWHEYKGQDNSALVNLLFYIFVVSRTT